MPPVPQPPQVVAERLGEQGERRDQDGLVDGPRQNAGGHDGQHDPLRRSHELAPVAGRQLRAHPRQRPSSREEHVPCGADREHPRADGAPDVHAEDQDQERVDLGVEVRAQRACRPGATRDPSVDRVQRQRERRERHQQGHRFGPSERVGDQRGDGPGEGGSSKRHPVGRAQPVGGQAGEAVRQRGVRGHSAGDSDDPARGAEAEVAGPGERGEQQQLGDQGGQRSGLDRSHHTSRQGDRVGRNRRGDGRGHAAGRVGRNHLPGAPETLDPVSPGLAV